MEITAYRYRWGASNMGLPRSKPAVACFPETVACLQLGTHIPGGGAALILGTKSLRDRATARRGPEPRHIGFGRAARAFSQQQCYILRVLGSSYAILLSRLAVAAVVAAAPLGMV
jgi:hypothetical protein